MMLCVPSRRWKAARLERLLVPRGDLEQPAEARVRRKRRRPVDRRGRQVVGVGDVEEVDHRVVPGASSGGVFQAAMAMPRGRRTRANSSSARSTSNQWKACPAHAASALAVLQRQRLRRALEHGDARELALEHGAQRRVRLDGDERAGELARACA